MLIETNVVPLGQTGKEQVPVIHPRTNRAYHYTKPAKCGETSLKKITIVKNAYVYTKSLLLCKLYVRSLYEQNINRSSVYLTGPPNGMFIRGS